MSTLEKVKKVVVDQLSCETPDEEAEKIQTVQDAVNYIDSHK